jgi:ABC-type dipeptide/oligopeptide/nickel transport system permease component
MLRYIGSRLLQSAFIVVSITLGVFVILRVTSGDPARLRAPVFASPDVINQYRKDFGTDHSLLNQLGRFVSGALHGNLGESFRYQRPVLDLIGEALPYTLRLAGLALLISLAVSVTLGVLAARYPGSAWDWISAVIAAAAQAAPVFWVGILLSTYLGVVTGLFPAGGYSGFSSLVLPAVAASISIIPTELRVLREAMRSVLGQEYVRAARANGIAERRVTFVYALRNATLPLLTVVGIDVGYLLGGVIVAEVVFNFPGIGQLALVALNSRDYPLVQGITIVTSTVFVLVNLGIDLLYTVVDPRIRLRTR